MAKTLRCSDIIPGCTFVAKGQTREEVFLRASEHVRLAHKIRGISPEVIAVIHGVIFDDDPARDSRSKNNTPDSDVDGAAGNPWWPAASERPS